VFTAILIEGGTLVVGFLTAKNRWWQSVVDVLLFGCELAVLSSAFDAPVLNTFGSSGYNVHYNER
jgi:hypothetical protein